MRLGVQLNKTLNLLDKKLAAPSSSTGNHQQESVVQLGLRQYLRPIVPPTEWTTSVNPVSVLASELDQGLESASVLWRASKIGGRSTGYFVSKVGARFEVCDKYNVLWVLPPALQRHNARMSRKNTALQGMHCIQEHQKFRREWVWCKRTVFSQNVPLRAVNTGISWLGKIHSSSAQLVDYFTHISSVTFSIELEGFYSDSKLRGNKDFVGFGGGTRTTLATYVSVIDAVADHRFRKAVVPSWLLRIQLCGMVIGKRDIRGSRTRLVFVTTNEAELSSDIPPPMTTFDRSALKQDAANWHYSRDLNARIPLRNC
ncbi:hypothetical protein EDD15DRAFT_2516163 [Pisolithus albus]|nr:hypothetical protein EDD15DRAFT_2516163 [Pisolithus albus]